MGPRKFRLKGAAFSTERFWGVGEASLQFCGIRKTESESYGGWTEDPPTSIRS
jgi:hypothetical protein